MLQKTYLRSILSIFSTFLFTVVCLFLLSIFKPASSFAISLESFKPYPVPIPIDNPQTPEKIKLGKMLFFDPRLSGNGSMSCSTCHIPAAGFVSPTRLSLSFPSTMHWRAVDSVIDAAYLKYLFWDGRAGSLEQQALGPIGAPFEMNMHLHYLTARLYEIPQYRKMFNEVFHTGLITPDMVAKAIASFERTIVVTQTPFYSYVDGDKNALSKQQLAGFRLFTGKAGCIRCHYGPFFTDNGFHALGVPELHLTGDDKKLNASARHYFAYGAGIKNYNAINRDMGRYFITHKKSDMDKFGTPSLIDVVGPYYMHNGSIEGLLNVIKFFNEGGGTDVPNKSKMLHPLHLTSTEEKELVAFLRSLNGPAFVISQPELPPYSATDVSEETMSAISGSPVSIGMELIKSQDCLACHSINGVGGKMSVDLSNKGIREHSISWLETQIATPEKHFKPGDHEVLLGKLVYNVMPDHKLLTKEQLRYIAVYLKSLK